MSDEPKKRRGFAAMSIEQRTELASRGGKAAHALGKGHTWTTDEAKIAGRKGGLAKRKQPKQETTNENPSE